MHKLCQIVDHGLEDNSLSTQDLLSLKEQLIQTLADYPQHQFDLGLRLARINLRLKKEQPSGLVKDVQDLIWLQNFKSAAKRLLDPAQYDILVREANARVADAKLAFNSNHADNQEKKKKEKTKSVVTQSAKIIPLHAPLHSLVVNASSRPMKFDPTVLFKEFGRDRVLATWNMCLPENRPETAHEFRIMLIRLAKTGELGK